MSVSYISCEKVQEWTEKGESFVMVDLLPDDHFTKVHLPGAVNACVYKTVFLDELAEVIGDNQRPIVLYGAGDRSRDAEVATEKMSRAGYRNVQVLEGGLEQWRQKGYPLSGEGPHLSDSPATLLDITDGTYALAHDQSGIKWTGRNQNSTHFGTVACQDGSLTVAGGKTVTGHLTVDMRTISNINLAGDELQPVLEAHLKSDDFFFVERFPLAKLVVNCGDLCDEPYLTRDNCRLKGDLTLRGVTTELEFNATMTTTPNGNLLVEAHFDLDRTKWGIIYGSARFFEFLGMHQVFDAISIEMRLRLEKRAER